MNIYNHFDKLFHYFNENVINQFTATQKKTAAVALIALTITYIIYREWHFQTAIKKLEKDVHNLESSHLEIKNIINCIPKEVKKSIHNKEVQLFVKALDGFTYTLETTLGNTVLEFKQKIEKINGNPVDQQRLIFAGKQLEDDVLLCDYKIVKHSTIQLVLRLRGD